MKRLALLLCLASCSSDPLISAPFSDIFERAEIGADYYNSGGPYRIESGKLVVKDAKNHPLWLRRRLPENVRIELDVTSRSPDGDIKVEAFGDGQSYESADSIKRGLAYTTTSYVFIFGGWKNSRSVLARMEEHLPSAPARVSPRVEPNRTYRFKIERRGPRIDWFIDGQPFLSFTDPSPLGGKGHDHFGFTGWQAEVVFDNLSITPL